MRVAIRLAWIPLLVIVSSCCTPRLPKPDLTGGKCEMPPSCPAAPMDGAVVITVSADGTANPDCVTIDPKANTVTWAAAKGSGIDVLNVAFKNEEGRPPNPLCSGPLCFLPEEAPGAPEGRDGLFCYAMVLHTQSGRIVTVDPKLIIKY